MALHGQTCMQGGWWKDVDLWNQQPSVPFIQGIHILIPKAKNTISLWLLFLCLLSICSSFGIPSHTMIIIQLLNIRFIFIHFTGLNRQTSAKLLLVHKFSGRFPVWKA